MARKRCNACLGEYDTVQRDGSSYAHVCGPTTIVKATLDDGGTIVQSLDAYKGFVIVPDQASKDALVATGTPKGEIAIEISRTEGRRGRFRDENPDERAKPVDGKLPIKSEGAGVVDLP